MTKTVAIITLALLCATSFSYDQRMDDAWRGYSSVPKGVTLEGTAEGFPPLSSIRFEEKNNRFMINGDIAYTCPIERKEFGTLLKALQQDDRAGMSITDLRSKAFITYGTMNHRSHMMRVLLDSDLFLSDVAFARTKSLGSIQLPNAYVPQAVEKRTIPTVVHFNITDFAFAVTPRQENAPAELHPTQRTLEVNLIPVEKKQKRGGGYMPDTERLTKGEMHPEDVANATHLRENQAWYLAHPRVEATVRYGEAAAFCRLLLQSGMDIKPLLKELR